LVYMKITDLQLRQAETSNNHKLYMVSKPIKTSVYSHSSSHLQNYLFPNRASCFTPTSNQFFYKLNSTSTCASSYF